MYRHVVFSVSQLILLVAAVLMISQGLTDVEELLNCNTTRHTQLLNYSNSTNCVEVASTCKISDSANTYSVTLSKTKSSNSCLFIACLAVYNNNSFQTNDSSCVLYELDSCPSEDICSASDPPQDDETREEGKADGTENGLIAFVVILIVALIVAVFVIITMVLMIRDMQNERIENGLPNPYSCIFTAVRSVFTPSEKPAETSKPQRKPKKQKEEKKPAPKHYTRREETAVEEPESPDHDPDDYEEMDQAKRDSFLEGGGEDVYQNY